MKMTEADVAKLTLPAGKTEAIYWDSDLPGFGVRLRGDSKRWVCQYRLGAQQRRESLGDIRKVKLTAAREIARKRFASIELGVDPVAVKKTAKAEAEANKLTVETVVQKYLAAKQGNIRPSTFGQAKLHLEQHFKTLHKKPLHALTRADVAKAINTLSEKRGRVAAGRARTNLSSMLVWAMRQGLIENNACMNTENPAAGIPSRERVLSDEEIGIIWRYCPDSDFGRIVRLLILTGCRREEIGSLRWDEIDLDKGVISLSAERTKNGRQHVLILPSLARNILEACPRRAGHVHVFGSGNRGFNSWGALTDRLRLRIAEELGRPLPHWCLHDCRRTFRSGLGRLGIPPHIGELALNHRKGGKIEEIYNRYQYTREVGEALAAWALHVREIIATDIATAKAA